MSGRVPGRARGRTEPRERFWIPIGPYAAGKDGAWRGASAIAGAWTFALIVGLVSSLPDLVLSRSGAGGVLLALLAIGLVMSGSFGVRWWRHGPARGPDDTGELVREVGPDGVLRTVPRTTSRTGLASPTVRGVHRSLENHWALGRALLWDAPVTFGDFLLTGAWNGLMLLFGSGLGRTSIHASGERRNGSRDDW